MPPDSLKRLCVFAATAALMLLQPLLAKVGLHMSPAQLAGFASVAGLYLAQSGGKAIVGAWGQNKAFQAMVADGAKLKAFLDQVRATQAQAAGKAAAQVAPPAGQPGGPSQS